MKAKTVFYARVSTLDQTVAHQATQAKAAGFKIDRVIADEGVSGVSTVLRERPQGHRLFDLLNEGDTLVVRWLDRLGRNYMDVCDTIREFIRQGVIIKTVINGLTFDGTTRDPMEMAICDAMIAFLAAMAQAQAEATKVAMRAGIEHAKTAQKFAYLGRRPTFTREHIDLICNAAPTTPVIQLAKETGLQRQTVYRIRANPAVAIAMVTTWAAAEAARRAA